LQSAIDFAELRISLRFAQIAFGNFFYPQTLYSILFLPLTEVLNTLITKYKNYGRKK